MLSPTSHLLSTLLLAAPSYTSPIVPRQAADYIFSGDAPYGIDTTTLSSVLTCPNGNPSSTTKAVLLVHGTGSTGSESWGQGYIPALTSAGYTPCYIDLPNRAMGDMQLSSSYIAYNLHAVSALAGNPVAVMGHSQANPDINWALHFWPSTHAVTSMYIGLSPDFSGVGLPGISDLCDLGPNGELELCQPSLWQQAAGSHYYSAFAASSHASQIPTTVIWSLTDEVVVPPPLNAALPGADVIAVQELCPGRITDHLSMVIDSAGYALALDALGHGGKASLARVAPRIGSVCTRLAAPGMDVTVPATIKDALDAVVKGIILTTPKTKAEPPVMAYAL
ncbi:MAG: hypothetical protein M1828_002748 [Chrysothrix sp. TS-e1954]|nr:MAG: hypothetical protein M1828_002748 [Chrysothrix sp. TS-e1954]